MYKLIIDTYMHFMQNARYYVKMFKYDIMNIIFPSSRARGRQEQQVDRAGDTVNITLPSQLVLMLLTEEAILLVQIRPVPYIRQDSAQPLSRLNSGRSSMPTSRPNSGRPPGHPVDQIRQRQVHFPIY